MIQIKIYCNFTELPYEWNSKVAVDSILLSQQYFASLNDSQPVNLKTFFLGFFLQNELIGGAIVQHLLFSEHNSFQKQHIWCSLKNFLTKRYAKDVLIVGNNMLTGQNSFYYDKNKVSTKQFILALQKGVQMLTKKIGKSSMLVYKDFTTKQLSDFNEKSYRNHYRFSVQPNMVLKIPSHWKTPDDYIQNFSTKYRSRAKSARKKIGNIIAKELTIEDTNALQNDMQTLYSNVVSNARFNTFFLRKNHFQSLKNNLKEDFVILGYFEDNQLVGFCTMIRNKNSILDTYFLGYNDNLQKEKQLYLNMLLDMVHYGIEQSFKKIIFGRTALEIKSTIGAEPQTIYGLLKHENILINKFMYKIFPILEPKQVWIQRKPFK